MTISNINCIQFGGYFDYLIEKYILVNCKLVFLILNNKKTYQHFKK